MDFFQIQPQTSMYIELSMKNYLAWSLKICGRLSDYRHFSKNSKRHKIQIRESILTTMISKDGLRLL